MPGCHALEPLIADLIPTSAYCSPRSVLRYIPPLSLRYSSTGGKVVAGHILRTVSHL
jgi:hypothetical protein